MTPQSELQRLLGIPPDQWDGELKGMSDEMLITLIQETEDSRLFNAIDCELLRRRKEMESQPC